MSSPAILMIVAKAEPALTWAMVVADAERRYAERWPDAGGFGYLTMYRARMEQRGESQDEAHEVYRRLRDAVSAAVRYTEGMGHPVGVYAATLAAIGRGPLLVVDRALQQTEDLAEKYGDGSNWEQWFRHVAPLYKELQPLDHAVLRVVGRIDPPLPQHRLDKLETPAKVFEFLADRAREALRRRTPRGAPG